MVVAGSRGVSRLVVISIVLIASLSLRLFYIEYQPYWVDEAYTRWFVQRSFHELWFWVPSFESHPPTYYTITKIWNILFPLGNFSERYFSLSLSVFLALFLAFGFRGVFQQKDNESFAIIVIALFMSYPILVWYSVEARPYILYCFAYAVAILGFYKIINSPDSDNNWSNWSGWTLLTVGIILTNWMHSTGPLLSFIIYACLLFHVLIFSSKNHLKMFVLSTAVAFLFSIPLLMMLISQVTSWRSGSWIPEPTLKQFIGLSFNLFSPITLQHLVLSLIGEGAVFNIIDRLLRLVFPILAVFSLYQFIKCSRFQLIYLAIFAALPPLLFYIISMAGPNILLDRILLPVIVPFLLMISVLIANFYIRFVNGGTVLFLILLASILYGSYFQLSNGRKEPWDNIYLELQMAQNKGDTILVFPNAIAHAIEWAGAGGSSKLDYTQIPFDYPAIGLTDYSPGGTPGVAGLRKEDMIYIAENVNFDSDGITVVTRSARLFDPNGYLRETLENLGFELIDQSKVSGSIFINKYRRLKARLVD